MSQRNAELARSIRRAAAEKSGPVVAILGGLHVNGVARLLMADDTPDADGRDADGVWWEAPYAQPTA
jgi:pheromone shutdown protein TraB